MIQLLQQLYGDDVLNTALKFLFEFLSYLLSGVVGAALRELLVEKHRSCGRAFGSSLLVAVILFSVSSYLQSKINDSHLVFGFAVLLGFYLPSFTTILRNGRMLKHILRFFSEKSYTIVKDMEEEEARLRREEEEKSGKNLE